MESCGILSNHVNTQDRHSHQRKEIEVCLLSDSQNVNTINSSHVDNISCKGDESIEEIHTNQTLHQTLGCLSKKNILEPPVSDEPSISQPEIDISINNVVCAFALRCHLNLKEIARTGRHVEYKKENSMLNMKIRHPMCTASIWSSGKVTVTGATSNDMAYRGARCVARVIQKLGFKVTFCNFRVVNVLATCSLPFGVNIREFSDSNRPAASYEPELHPAVTYRISSPKATLKLFSTGSVTVTAPTISNVQSAVETIYPKAEEHKTAYDPRPEYGEHRQLYRSLKKRRQQVQYDYDSSSDDEEAMYEYLMEQEEESASSEEDFIG